MRTGDAEKGSTDDRCSADLSEQSWLWVFDCWLAVGRRLTDQWEKESRLERRFVMFSVMNCVNKTQRVAARAEVISDGKEIGGREMTKSTTEVRESGGRFDPPLRWNVQSSLTVNDE